MKIAFKSTARGKTPSSLRGTWAFSLLALLFFVQPVSAQRQKPSCMVDCSCDMAGRVVDQQSQKPLPYATVQLKGTSVGTIADEDGIFHLHNLCDDEFDLTVSFVGYKPVSHHHDLYHPDPVIYLSPDDTQLESVVVEGKRPEEGMISATVTSISPEEISSRRGERIGEVLEQLSGVNTLSTGQNVVKPIIHGLHSSRILIINNGVRHEGQNWGPEHAPEIDPAQINSIRLIKGAASVKYGPGALGGVIIVEPQQPTLGTSLKGSTDLTLQSNGRAAGATITVQEGYSNFAWIGQAAGLYQGDLHTPDYMLSNTGARELSVSAGALYHKRRMDLSVRYSYVQQKLGVLRGSVVGNERDLINAMTNEPPAYTQDFTYTINTPNQQVNHHLLNVNNSWSFGTSTLNFQYGFQANSRQEFDVRRGTNNLLPSINLNLFTHSFDTEWQHPVWGLFSGSTGIQLQYQDNNNVAGTNTTAFLPNYNSLTMGVYLAESIELGKTIIDAGLRYDFQQASIRGRDVQQNIFRDQLTYHTLTASTGFLQPLNAWSSLQSNLGLAWRPPNMAELFSFGRHDFVIEYGLRRFKDGNSGIFTEEEQLAPSELGYKWVNTYSYQKNKLSLELTGYLNYIRNYIFTRPAGITNTVRGSLPYFVFDQTDALLAGLDGSMELEHTSFWKSALQLSFLTASDIAQGDRFVGIPPNRIRYSLSYQDASLGRFKNFSAGLETSYTFEQYLAPPVISPQQLVDMGTDTTPILPDSKGFDFMEAPEGFFLFHFSTGIERGRFSYLLRVKNLLNTSYREYTNRLRYFADEPGRNFVLTAKHSF